MKKSNGILLLCVLLAGCGSQSTTSNEVVQVTEEAVNATKGTEFGMTETATASAEVKVSEAPKVPEEISLVVKGETFVKEFNSNNKNSLEFVEDFVPSDKDSPHYRTEFRLMAYEEAIGKSYTYGNATVDIVIRKDYFEDVVMRIYMDSASLKQCIAMIKTASPIMDVSATTNEIQEAVEHIKENKEANGYYYAGLGLGLSGNDKNGYELMLKMEND